MPPVEAPLYCLNSVSSLFKHHHLILFLLPPYSMILAVALLVLSLSFSTAQKNSLLCATQHQGSLLPLGHFHLCFEPTYPPAQLLFLCWASCYPEGQGHWIKTKGLGFQFPRWKFSRGFCGAFQRIQIAKPFEHWRLRVWAYKHLASRCTSGASQKLPVCILFSLCTCERACPSYHGE